SLQRGLDEFGHTFRSLTTHVRMAAAQELLRETTMTLTEIANELSYSSHSHFTRAFHAHADMTPSEFRQL
ncbi:MAG: helix-turn-helix transcriptional regulator, partial [Paracoccaceae bacterium]